MNAMQSSSPLLQSKELEGNIISELEKRSALSDPISYSMNFVNGSWNKLCGSLTTPESKPPVNNLSDDALSVTNSDGEFSLRHCFNKKKWRHPIDYALSSLK